MKASQINNLRSFWVQNIQRYLYLTAGQTSLRLRISGFRLRSGRSTIHLRQIFESGSFSPRCAIAWLVSSRNRWVLARWGRKLFSCQNFEVIRHPSTRKECGLWISLYLLLQMSALLSALINQRWQGSILVGYGQLDLACFSIISSDIFVRTWWTRCSQTWSVYCFFKTVFVHVDEVYYDRTTLLLSYWIINALWSQFSYLPCPPTLSSVLFSSSSKTTRPGLIPASQVSCLVLALLHSTDTCLPVRTRPALKGTDLSP